MHPYKLLTYKGKKVEIDKDIAPLISKMWKLKIGTRNCCQNYSGDGRVWIVFDNARSMSKFFIFVFSKYEVGKSLEMHKHIRGFTVNTHPGLFNPILVAKIINLFGMCGSRANTSHM
jgi:hypothetical protein